MQNACRYDRHDNEPLTFSLAAEEAFSAVNFISHASSAFTDLKSSMYVFPKTENIKWVWEPLICPSWSWFFFVHFVNIENKRNWLYSNLNYLLPY